MTIGARDNLDCESPDCENPAVAAELDEETTVYRIFRQRHTVEDPLGEADRWIRQVKKHCPSSDGELRTTAVRNDADGGSVLVAVIGREIIARKENLLGGTANPRLGEPGSSSPRGKMKPGHHGTPTKRRRGHYSGIIFDIY